MTTIYAGQLQNVTVDMLHVWLCRRWLPLFVVSSRLENQDEIIRPLTHGVFTQTDILARDWRGVIKFKLWPYDLHWDIFTVQPDGVTEWCAHIRAYQLYVDQVDLVYMEPNAWPFGDTLHWWLKEYYDSTLRPLTPGEQKEFDLADEDGRERLLHKFVAMANKDREATLEAVAATLSTEIGQWFTERELRRIAELVKSRTGRKVWPNRRRGPQGRRTR